MPEIRILESKSSSELEDDNNEIPLFEIGDELLICRDEMRPLSTLPADISMVPSDKVSNPLPAFNFIDPPTLPCPATNAKSPPTDD